MSQQQDDKSEVKFSCHGPNANYVKLVSQDGHTFFLQRDLAVQSSTLRAMLSGPGAYDESNESNEVTMRDIPSRILRKACHYLSYLKRYNDVAEQIPEFVISKEDSLELLMTASFLDC